MHGNEMHDLYDRHHKGVCQICEPASHVSHRASHASHSTNVKNLYLFYLQSHENILDEFFTRAVRRHQLSFRSRYQSLPVLCTRAVRRRVKEGEGRAQNSLIFFSLP